MTVTLERSARTYISAQEAADRLAIRELFDAYAYCADRRDVEGQMSLFTVDTEFLVFMDSRDPHPTQRISGREGLRPVFENLNTYVATTHFNGQSTVSWDDVSANGVSYCLAHHVRGEGKSRSIMIASIRYFDHFVKLEDRWYFQQRKLMVDWTDSRPLSSDLR